MITLENLIQRFKVFADAHLVVKTFTHGQRADFNNMKDDEFPLMHVEYLPVSYPYTREGGEAVFSFRIWFADKPTIEEDKNEQGHYSLNDMMLCAQDLLAQIKQDDDVWYEDIEINGTPRLEWFQESFSNNLWGCVLNIDLSVPFNYNECDAPIAPITLPSSVDCPDCSSLCELIAEATITGIVDCLSSQQLTDLRAEICEVCTFTPIRLLATTDTEYAEIETEPADGEFTLPDFPVNIGGGQIALPLDTMLNIVVAGYASHSFITVAGVGSAITITAAGTYRNSASPTFTQVINAGSVFTAPEITITEVDGVTTRNEPPNEDITCAWVEFNVRATDGTGLLWGSNIPAFPAGGNADIAYYRFRQPSGTQFGGDFAARLAIQLMNADISDVTNLGGTTQVTVILPLNIPSDALWTAIKDEMTATQITAAEDDLCDVCPTPLGIAYPSITPATSYIDASASGHDTVALWQAGAYDTTKPTYPTHIACLDKSDAARTTLVDNNFFGNKYRYTDTAGNPSSEGTTVPDRIDWKNHDWAGAVENIVIDHFFKCMYWVEYLDNAGRYSIQNTSIGDTWYNWLDHIDGLTIGGYSDWLPIPMDTRLPHAAHANQGETTYSKFFITQRSDGRCGFITGESLNATHYYPFRDSGNLNLITSGTAGDGSLKSSEGGFTASITLVYCMRMLTDADITALLA